ncbi:MAG: hypothetical protein ABWY55_06380 [Microbacterium sp.]
MSGDTVARAPEGDALGSDALEAPESEADQSLRGGMVKILIAVLANVGVLTALLVYFGWVRSERFASYLGIDEAVFSMSVDEYVRRSVQSVFILPLAAAVAALAWVAFDHWWRRRRSRLGADDRVVVFFARWMWVLAVAVFVLGVVFWIIGYAWTYIAAPMICTAGLLLFLYSFSLRATLPGAVPFAPLTEGVLRGAVAILAAIGLFSSATNFAIVEGTELGRTFGMTVATLPEIEVDSDRPLDIVAPGVLTSCFTEGETTRYHYRGLRYLESTGGNYFLISRDWTPDYGIVVILPMSDEGLRYTFVKDAAGDRDSAYPPCEEGSTS